MPGCARSGHPTVCCVTTMITTARNWPGGSPRGTPRGAQTPTPVRTCFRIVPPSAEEEDGESPALPAAEDSWRIEFALQAVDDPSLVVPAADVWSDGPELTAMERHVTHPDEVLLRGLGQAARLVPALGHALASAAPCEHTTDAAGILTFLRDGAPLLEEAGFGVLAPPWWRSRTRLGLRLKARSRSKVGAAVPPSSPSVSTASVTSAGKRCWGTTPSGWPSCASWRG